MSYLRHLLVLLCLILPPALWAAPLAPEQVPDPLKSWIPWVMNDTHDQNCPYLYAEDKRVCTWPGKLELQLTEQGGTFTQRWQIYGDTTIRLPGDAQHWPHNVRNDQNQPLTVIPEEDYPTLKLTSGTYIIQGDFLWDKLPKTLFVSPEAGLIELTVNGKAIPNPNFNEAGQLWLTQNNDEGSEDNLDIQVFRKLSDSHPIQILTSIQLRVSGKQRNVELKPVLLKGFIPLSINSKLPARIEANQQLQVQLRPGEWTIEVVSRAPTNQTTFTLPESQQPWPSQEVWAFAADHSLRQVEVTGVPSIDPSQTKLPADWNSLPAYLMNTNDTLTLNEQHRGMALNESTDLKLEREMWLDFSGAGYTLKDRLNGTLSNQTRLNVVPEVQLGRVVMDGKAQLITQQGDKERPAIGVEIRQQALNLAADSRFEASLNHPPANGWQQELQGIATQLHLPPGWRLMYASGMDNRPDTWLEQWSLLDLFLVLIIALAVGYLYGWGWGVVSLLALVFLWHEPYAPRWIWLNLLAVTALLLVIPNSLFRTILHYYRLASLVVLALIVVPYMISTVRTALYPQLDQGYGYYYADATGYLTGAAMAPAPSAPAPEPQMVDAEEAMVAQDTQSNVEQNQMYKKERSIEAKMSATVKGISSNNGSLYYDKRAQNNLQSIDPNSMVQTGPGLPNWRWKSVQLNWSGPIRPDDSMYLMFMNPMSTFMWKIFSIGLLLILAWRLIWPKGDAKNTTNQQWQHFKKDPMGVLKAQFILSALVALTVTTLALTPKLSLAADVVPDDKTLEELKQRLLAAPDCLPQCAQIETMQLQVQGDQLIARLKAHAATTTAIPLPSSPANWLPQQVLVDGTPTLALRRDESQTLWVVLTQGQHDLVLQGTLPKRTSFGLDLPLKPYRVTWEGADWSIDGIRDNGVPETQLQLTRTAGADTANLEHDASTLPPFVKIERTLNIGLDWYVETVVTRLSDTTNPMSITIPLLAGEQPMSDQITIKDGQVKANFKAQEATVTWSSRIKQAAELVLTAAANPDYLEEWRVAASPIWHVEGAGIPVNAYGENEGIAMPIWKPWPKETLTLAITRPEGVAGQTVTILSSNLKVTQGKRAKDVALTLVISSSRGTQHTITLPEGVEVKNLTIQGEKRPVQQQANKLILPLNPTEQTVLVEWQENSALDMAYIFPAVDLGLTSVNSTTNINLDQDRWVLWVKGPDLGPAVLFWGVLIALFVVALILGRSKITPLKTWQWFLLAIGLSQSSTYLMVLIVVWLVAITQRENLTRLLPDWAFNTMQIALASLTLFALIALFGAVANGLLGQPDMQISGNDSSAYNLNWYQDRTGTSTQLPQPFVLSVPILVYRFLMLLWALWLAIAVLGWLRWGWKAFSTGGIWHSTPKVAKARTAPAASVAPQASVPTTQTVVTPNPESPTS